MADRGRGGVDRHGGSDGIQVGARWQAPLPGKAPPAWRAAMLQLQEGAGVPLDFVVSRSRGALGPGKAHGRALIKPVPAALVVALLLAGCMDGGQARVQGPGDPGKPVRACLAVDEATPLAMSAADRRACEDTMRGWYAETWYGRGDPADRYAGEAQLDYLRAKALDCRRAADAYELTGRDRWFALMRCLVIVRSE